MLDEMARTVPTVLSFVVGVPVALACLELLGLSILCRFHRPNRAGDPSTRLAVIVPAHNEAALIGSCVRSLVQQEYPPELRRVVVVADNCSDATADIAQRSGAEVLVRSEPGKRGKGAALRWAIDRVLADPDAPEAVVVVDADAVAAPDFLRELVGVFQRGHAAVQADDILAPLTSKRAALEGAALLLRNRVRFAGRAVLGLPATLCGNGMLLSRSLLTEHPWSAFSQAEDVEYSLSLLCEGVPVAFAMRAVVAAAPTANTAGAVSQSLRWDGGRLDLARRWTPRLLRAGLSARDMRRVAIAADLAVPPLSMLAGAGAVGLVASAALVMTGLASAWAVAPWVLAVVSIPVYLTAGLSWCRVPRSTYAAALEVPAFLLRKGRVYARLARGGRTTLWVRTQRPGEHASEPVASK